MTKGSKTSDVEIIHGGDTAKDAEFLKALQELLSIPAQKGGRTSRRLLIARQVYHENDRPLIGDDKKK